MIVTSGLAAVALALNAFGGTSRPLDDFTVPQSLTAPAGEVVGQVVGDGLTSCWYISGCFRDVVIDNTRARHATTAWTRYNPEPLSIGPNYEFVTHVEAGDAVTIHITWDVDDVSGNFGNADTDVRFAVDFWLPVFFPYMTASPSRPGSPTVRMTLRHDDGLETYADVTDFGAPYHRVDGYIAPMLFARPCSQPAGLDDPWSCFSFLGLRLSVTVQALDEPVDFALRRLYAPEPGSSALVPIALALLAPALARGRHRGAPSRRLQPGPASSP